MNGRRGIASALLVAAAMSVAACSTPAPTASNAIPPPAVVDEQPLVWAVMGGPESVAFEPARSWTQQVLAGLPPSTELLELATEDASLIEAAPAQLAALDAAPRPPTVATVWFGVSDPEIPPATFTAALTGFVQELQARGIPKIVLVARPDVAGQRRFRYSAEVEAVAAVTGTPYVAIDLGLTNPFDPGGQTAIAQTLAPFVATP